ncbi:MAG: choice-of-anchor tandem repeat GloVer-containing protein [Limisphaerales bacterium]
MNHRILKGFWFVVLFTLGTVLPVHAQSNFTTLWSFDFIDGAWPQAGLILSGNTLYGTTVLGGGSYASYGYGYGTVFSVNTNGTEFTDYRFTGGSDGANPSAGLILSGNRLYGTTKEGGSSSKGTIFAVNTDGTDFTILYSFTETSGFPPTNSDGACPLDSLLLSGNTLYGTTFFGGSSGCGTVFSVNTNGTDFKTLYSFTDGANPVAGLILSGNTLYGTASGNGINYDGTVFAVNTDGTGFTNLYSFTGDSDGGAPYAGLILSGNTLYGTTAGWGYTGSTGTVFAINTDGTGFKTLHNFSGGNDGAYPQTSLILSGNTLYGTTSAGGISNNGTVFAVNTDGAGFTTLYSFTALSGFGTNSDGAIPNGLILSGNTLYGTTYEGGANDDGTIFALKLSLVDNVTATAVEHPLVDIVTLSCDTEGAKIEYQIQPGHAAANERWMRYSSPIYVFHIETKTLYCRAVKGRTTSEVTSFVYTGNSRYNH